MTRIDAVPRAILRQCVACRRLLPRDGMVRLTCSKASQFSIDGEPRLQGRSAYACSQKPCLAEALKGKKFQRALKRGIPDAILEALNDQLKGITAL